MPLSEPSPQKGVSYDPGFLCGLFLLVTVALPGQGISAPRTELMLQK